MAPDLWRSYKSLRNLLFTTPRPHTNSENVSSLPQPYAKLRAPRAQLDGVTPAVLRLPDGQRTSGHLHVLSTGGGLLSLPNPLLQGSQVKLMFLTGAGSVLGGAEMLTPVNHNQQAFRFVSLAPNDQRRVRATIDRSRSANAAESQWIEKLRAAGSRNQYSRQRFVKLFAGVAGLVTLGLAAGAIYFFR